MTIYETIEILKSLNPKNSIDNSLIAFYEKQRNNQIAIIQEKLSKDKIALEIFNKSIYIIN